MPNLRSLALGSLLLCASAASAAPALAAAGLTGLRLVSADAGGLTFEYVLPSYRIEAVETPVGPRARIVVPGLSASAEPGRPELPLGGVWIAMPPLGGATLEILEETADRVPDVDVLPVFRPSFRDAGGGDALPERTYERDDAAYAEAGPTPGAVARLDGEQWLRFQRVTALRVQPVRYLPASRTLLVTRRVVARIRFAQPAVAPQAMAGAALAPAPANDRQLETLYESSILNAAQGRAWRARPARVSAGRSGLDAAPPPVRALGALDLGTGNPEWKVRVDTTGVWRVTFEQLAAKGWPTAIEVERITAFRRDTTVALSPAPWTCVELAADVIDRDSDGRFGAGDFLVLPVRNWTDRTQPNYYERRYGDYEIVWLSYKNAGEIGRRPRPESGWLGALAPARPASFPSFRHYERNFFYIRYVASLLDNDQFFWTDGFVDETPIDSLIADLPDLDPAGADIALRLEWIGNSNGRHDMTVAWANGANTVTTLVTDTSFFSRQRFQLNLTMPAALATAGANRVRVSGMDDSPIVGSRAPLNWFEVTYPRRYRALQNRLAFTSGGAADTVEYVLEGFTGATPPPLYVYDVTDWEDPARLSVAPGQIEPDGAMWRARVQAVVPAPSTRQYVVAADVAPLPDGAITAETPSSLYLTPAGGADFVLIAHDAFADACAPIADLRRNQNISTLAAKAQDVYDEFNGGRKSHYAVRRFLRYALERWDTRFALFVGDGSEDARGWLGTSDVDYFPVPVIQGPVPVADGLETVPSDNWYAFALTGGNLGDDLLPDLSIGRWTASSVAETQALVAKSLAYESGPQDEPWRNRAVMIADDEYSTSTFLGVATEYCQKSSERVFRTINEIAASVIRGEGGFRDFDIRPFYLTDKLASITSFPGNSCTLAREFDEVRIYVDENTSPELFVLLSEGASFVNFQGHGNALQMTHEELWISYQFSQDIELIFNYGKPFYFSGYACHLNSFASHVERSFFGDAIGERMVNIPQRGAIASFASSAFELLPFNPANQLNVHVFRAFFVDPPHDLFAGETGARVRIGEATLLGVLRMVASTVSLEKEGSKTYILLGDPLTSMSFGPPRLYASAVDRDSLGSGVAYYPTVPADSVRITVEAIDEGALAALTVTEQGEGARGVVPASEYIVTPAFPDTGSGKRYEILHDFVPRPASYDVIYEARDRTDLIGRFVLRFVLEAVLAQGSQVIRDGDPALVGVPFVWQVRSPARLGADDFAVRVDGAPVSFTAIADPADTTGRTWALTVPNSLASGAHSMEIDVGLALGGVTRTVQFEVGTAEFALEQVFPFPNPFRDGTTINFFLTAGGPSDVRARIFTVSGVLVYERTERALPPGYHQWSWDGRDASGRTVAMGTYIVRIAAVQDGGRETESTTKLVRAPLATGAAPASGSP